MLEGSKVITKLPNGQKFIDWQYCKFLAMETQYEYIRRCQEVKHGERYQPNTRADQA